MNKVTQLVGSRVRISLYSYSMISPRLLPRIYFPQSMFLGVMELFRQITLSLHIRPPPSTPLLPFRKALPGTEDSLQASVFFWNYKRKQKPGFLGYLTGLGPRGLEWCCHSVSLSIFQQCLPQSLCVDCPAAGEEAIDRPKATKERDSLALCIHIQDFVKEGSAWPFLGMCRRD